MFDNLEFGRKITSDWEKASSKEWLTWNGRGGYASSTIIGMNTRRYHGLLITPMDPPWDRKLFLSKLEEEIEVGEKEYKLSTNMYPGTVHPKGFIHIDKFRLEPFPTIYYSLPGISLKKQIFMPYGKDAVIVRYEVEKTEPEETKLRILPLINSRSEESLGKMGFSDGRFRQEKSESKFKIFDSGKENPIMEIGSDLMGYYESDLPTEDRWYKNMVYSKETERGYEDREDHYNPGYFEIPIEKGKSKFHILSAAGNETENHFESIYSKTPESFERELENSLKRLQKIGEGSNVSKILESNDVWKSLVQVSDSFLVENGSILAGYHWFSTWGRDTLIALPGLTLISGRYDWAKKILLLTLDKTERGLVPNRFKGEHIEPNNSDASLLLIKALFEYLLYTDDIEIFKENWRKLVEIINRYSSSKKDKVGMDEDGLIWVEGGTTWMDAKVDGHCVTPREGKPVDINALWYNALNIMEEIGGRLNKDTNFRVNPDKVRKNFVEKFWNPERGYLSDVVRVNGIDHSLRPNQIFALSLPFTPLGTKKEKKVLSTIQEKLETPRGLRSLSRDSSNYRSHYTGDIRSRDLAYHQGTVWAWLMGPYVTSLCKIGGEKKRKHAEKLIESFLDEHLKEAGIGTISEVFDGDKPQNPGGCISQAWSVGEILRSYCEDVKDMRPPYEKNYLKDVKR